MLRFNIITLFPELFETHLKNLPFKRALEKGLIVVNIINLRDFAINKHGAVDDKPYGGGVGMILRVEPIYAALKAIGDTGTVLLTSPRGKKYSQRYAQSLSQNNTITIVCGRYEGVDARVEAHLVSECLSVGDYVLSGGELPALVIMESITRLLPGVLMKTEATKNESFSDEINMEHPQYTRPKEFNGWKVPDVLLSGHHVKIEKWQVSKQNQS